MSEAGDTFDLSRGELQRRALSGSFWTLVSVGLSLPLGLIANTLIARHLGPLEYGNLAFLLLVQTLALQISEFGFVVAQTQWGVEATIQGDRVRARRLLSQGFGFRLLVQLPILCLSGLVVLRNHGAAAQLAWFLVSLAYVPLVSVSMALLFENRMTVIARLTTFVNVIVQVGIVTAALATDSALPVALTRMGLGLLLHGATVFIVSGADRRAGLRPALPFPMPLGFRRFAVSAGLTAALSVLVYSRSEVMVLRLYGEVAAAGLFAVAFGLSQQLTAPVDALLAPLLPAVTGLVAAHPDHARRGTLRAIRYFALLTGAMVAVLPALVLAVPLLFGPAFERAAPLLLPLGLSSTFQSLASPVTLLAYARRQGRTLVVATGVALGLDLIAAFSLIPLSSLWGAVAANVLGQLTATGILVVAGVRAEQIPLTQLLRQVRPWLLGAMSIPFSFLLADAVPVSSGAVTPVVALVSGLVAFLMLLRLGGGGLERHDQEAMLGVVPLPLRGVARMGLRTLGTPR